MIEAETRADDGMELLRVETFQAATPDGLPGEAEIAAKIEKMASDLKALRAAPTGRTVRWSGAAFGQSGGGFLS